MTSRIIGMGETVMDILFHRQEGGSPDGRSPYVPFAAVPGGSTFNSLISVGRSGVPCLFMGYTGNNRVGQEIADFLRENDISTEYFQMREDERAALSLAYLDINGDADYTFYKEEPLTAACGYSLPEFTDMDYMLYGSYYSVCRGLRPQVKDTLEAAHRAGTVIYYDVNLRKSHQHQLDELTPRIMENCALSTIVRGSADDFRVLFGCTDPEEIYRRHIAALCPVFICTAGAGHIIICTPTAIHDFDVPLLPREEIISTVGAGDSFNAGFLCAMHSRGIRRRDIPGMDREGWEALVARGTEYASQVCRSRDNYIARRR